MTVQTIYLSQAVWAGGSGNLGSNWIVGYTEVVSGATATFIDWVYGTYGGDFDSTLTELGVTDTEVGVGGTLTGSSSDAINIASGASYVLAGSISGSVAIQFGTLTLVAGASIAGQQITLGFYPVSSPTIYSALVVGAGATMSITPPSYLFPQSAVIGGELASTGAGSSITVAGTMDVGSTHPFYGAESPAEITISSGGYLSVSKQIFTDSSDIDVDGNHSLLSAEGIVIYKGSSFSITNGGTVNLSGLDGAVGLTAEDDFPLNVSGMGSSLTIASGLLGLSADGPALLGSLDSISTVGDGAVVSVIASPTGYDGLGLYINGDTLNVTGSGSLLKVVGNAHIGFYSSALADDTGLLMVSDGGEVVVTGTVTTEEATLDIGGGGASMTIDGALFDYGHNQITDGGSLFVMGNADIGGPEFSIAGVGAFLTVAGALVDASLLTLSGSTVIADSITVEASAVLDGAGRVEANGDVGIVNNGTILATGGALTLNRPISGTGELTIAGGPDGLFVDGPVDIGQTVSFMNDIGSATSGGVLSIGDLGEFEAKILNFQTGDTIDLRNVTFPGPGQTGLEANFNDVTGPLTIESANYGSVSIPLGTLDFRGLPQNTAFALSADGNGGTDVTVGIQEPSLLTLADLDNATYGQDTYTGPGLSVDGYTVMDGTYDNSGFLADAFEDGNQVVVAIRGTDPFHKYNFVKNLLADASWALGSLGIPSTNPNRILATEVTDAALFLKKVRQEFPSSNLTISGHSLGGAVAQLLGNSSNYETIAFNAPGAAQFAQNLSSALAPAVAAGDQTSHVNENFRMYGDQVSWAGLKIGTQWTIASPYLDIWSNALSNHSLDTISQVIQNAVNLNLVHTIGNITDVPNIVSPDRPDAQLPLSGLILPASTEFVGTASRYGIAVTVVASVVAGAAAAVVAAGFYAFDPGTGMYAEFLGEGNSPDFSGFSLPAFPGIYEYNVSLLVDGNWQESQLVLPGTVISVPEDDTGIRYSAIDSNDNPVALPDGYAINAAFVSTGTFDGAFIETQPLSNLGGPATVEGSGSAAVLPGNGGADTVIALSGDETVETAASGALVFLGSGNDAVSSGGTDTIVGGSGSSTVAAVSSGDLVFSIAAPLQFIAGEGASTVVSGAVGATLFGGATGGTLMFGDGPTNYLGSGATDTVVGLAGSMTVQGGAGGGLYFGGTAGGNVITTGSGNVTAFGGGDGDVLTASESANNLFAGGGGTETLTGAGSSGTNTFFAGFGPETLAGGNGNTALVAGAGADLMMSGGGLTLFLFVAGRTAGAADTISGWDPTQDFVKLVGYAGDETTAVTNAAVINGSATLALSDGTQITFAGVTNLNASSFT